MTRNAVLGASVTAYFLALTACGANHYVRRGADLYGEGRYVEADEVFERSEPRVAQAPLPQQAAYATYRGATFLALGDLQRAQHWLGVASEIEHAQPGTLGVGERTFLDGAWRVLSNRLTPTPKVSTAIASSTPAPSPTPTVAPASEPQQRSLVPQ
jgi:hypothetical protein